MNDGLEHDQAWRGVDYPAGQFRADASVLDGVELIGSGSVPGIDVPPVVGSAAAIQDWARR